MADYRVIDVQQLEGDLTAVADAIREKTGGTEALTWPEGFVSGSREVWDAAEEEAYNRFWNQYQQNGSRTDYRFAFAGRGWSDMAKAGAFLPKYPIKPKNLYRYQDPAANMFCYFAVDASTPVDLSAVEMDFSGCTEVSNTFANCYVENIVCDFGNCWSMNRTFNANDTDRKGVNNLRLRVTETLTDASAPFLYAHQLVNLEFFGDSVIAVAGMDFGQSCKMSRTSIENVFRVLSDKTSGLCMTFNLTAVNNAFETSPGAADGSTSQDWAALVATKPNWSIILEDFIPGGGIQ